MSKKKVAFSKDVPWRAAPSMKPVPKIHHSRVLRVFETPCSNYALSVMKVSFGIQTLLAAGAAGPDCIAPGQTPPIKLLGLKIWPIDVDLRFLEPVHKELKNLGKCMDSAVVLMNKSLSDEME